MDGVTTVTDHVRYLSLRTWMLERYWIQQRPDSPADFNRYAQQVEAAIALGTLLAGPPLNFLVGSRRARARLDGGGELTLTPVAERPAADIYGGACQALGLNALPADARPRSLVAPTVERGQPLAAAVDARLCTTALGRLISDEGPPADATRADLEAFGEQVHLDRIGAQERALLTALLLPIEPAQELEQTARDQELRRLGSYVLLLSLAERLERPPTPEDVFAAAAEGGTALPEVLEPTLDGWALYGARDLLGVVHEAALRAVLAWLARDPVREVPVTEVVATLLSQPELVEPLVELGLLADDEGLEGLTWDALGDRLRDATAREPWSRGGVLRWRDGLSEQALVKLALAPGSTARPLALLPVAWMLCLRRVTPGLADSAPLFEHLGASWLSVPDDVRPRAGAWRQEHRPVLSCIADQLLLTVEGHLGVAWSRMQANASSDGLFLLSDGLTWRFRAHFTADRAASRLSSAVQWLRQLALLDDHGLTPEGRLWRDKGLVAMESR